MSVAVFIVVTSAVVTKHCKKRGEVIMHTLSHSMCHFIWTQWCVFQVGDAKTCEF